MNVWRLATVVLTLCLVSGCEKTPWRTQALPREQIQLPRAQGPVDLELPPRDTVVRAQLPDGTPLWVVHRKDGTVSVFSALLSRRNTNEVPRLVSWRPTLRRFQHGFAYQYASAYNDHGRNLGLVDCERCGAPPDPEHRSQALNDLDSFEVERLPGPPERIRLGAMIRGRAKHLIQKRLLPEAKQEPREFAVPGPLSVAQALSLPQGTTLMVKGKLVRASGEPPRICEVERHDVCCPENAPRLYDVDGIPMEDGGPMILNHQFFLLRRYRDGFVQYDVGRALDKAFSFSTLPKPPGYGSWDFSKPPPRSICR